MLPPVLVREEAMFGTGFFPTEKANIYEVPSDGLYLTGTSEVALAGLHMSEVLEPDELPLRYAGYSTCFRREAGAAGKETHGMFRVHQFDKVEMYVYARPEDSWQEHERMVAIEEEILQGLELPYRAVDIAAGDLGAPAARKIDLEAWLPSQGRYREVTSCSNTTDFQARRLKVRFHGERGTQPVDTMNGTAAVGLMLLARSKTDSRRRQHRVPEALITFGAPEKSPAGNPPIFQILAGRARSATTPARRRSRHARPRLTDAILNASRTPHNARVGTTLPGSSSSKSRQARSTLIWFPAEIATFPPDSGVRQRTNGMLLKTVGGSRPPWVRIPPPPRQPLEVRRLPSLRLPLLGLD